MLHRIRDVGEREASPLLTQFVLIKPQLVRNSRACAPAIASTHSGEERPAQVRAP